MQIKGGKGRLIGNDDSPTSTTVNLHKGHLMGLAQIQQEIWNFFDGKKEQIWNLSLFQLSEKQTGLKINTKLRD